MLVRDARPDDAAAMGELHARAWQGAYAGVFGATWLAGAADERRERWTTLLPRCLERGDDVLVAEVEHVVGLVHAGRSTEEECGELFAVYVDPDAWGSGAAAALCTEALTRLRARGHDRAVLWTIPEAARARSFYERTGWRVTGRTQEHDFGDGVLRTLVQYAVTEQSATAPSS